MPPLLRREVRPDFEFLAEVAERLRFLAEPPALDPFIDLLLYLLSILAMVTANLNFKYNY